MKLALALYEGFTALDIIGPFQVLADVPGMEPVFVAERAGPVTDHTGALVLQAKQSFDDVPSPDIIVVPGGMTTEKVLTGHPIVPWVRKVHETTTWTTSVCTGSLVLAAAGLLNGLEATTHWLAMDILAGLGAKPTGKRVVFQGKIVTAAGVSSGIDMGLALVEQIFGRQAAEAIQLSIEYDPQPPVDSGSPAKASPEVVAMVRAAMESGFARA
jgi:transcriptional regulator GlxA family with amidase domain